MDFLKLVQQGVEKSNQSLAAIAEVDGLFNQINADLKKYPAGELELDRAVSTIAQVAAFTNGLAGVESTHLRNDKIVLYLTTDVGKFGQDVAGWKQRAIGYPCVLKFDGQELSCSNATQLISGVGELLASVGFGNAVNNLIKQSSGSSEKKVENQRELQTSEGALMNKPVVANRAGVAELAAVKPAVSKAAVKAAATKASTKPAVAKTPAKHSTAKHVVKPAAVKAQAKPGGSKPAAKPAASEAPPAES